MKKVDKSSSAGTTVDSEQMLIGSTSASLLPNPLLGDVYEEILSWFTSNDLLIDWMIKPFLVGDKVVATDAHCLVAVPNITDRSRTDRSEKTKGVYPYEPNLSIEFSLEIFKDALQKVPVIDGFDEETKTIKCDECSGSGEVEFEYWSSKKGTFEIKSDCPVCEGEGEKEETIKKLNGTKVLDYSKYISIYGSVFRVENIERIIRIADLFNVNSLRLVYYKNPTSPAVFIVGECEVLIMPCLNSNNDGVVSNIA